MAGVSRDEGEVDHAFESARSTIDAVTSRRFACSSTSVPTWPGRILSGGMNSTGNMKCQGADFTHEYTLAEENFRVREMVVGFDLGSPDEEALKKLSADEKKKKAKEKENLEKEKLEKERIEKERIEL